MNSNMKFTAIKYFSFNLNAHENAIWIGKWVIAEAYQEIEGFTCNEELESTYKHSPGDKKLAF